jgi:hypothetical protein
VRPQGNSSREGKSGSQGEVLVVVSVATWTAACTSAWSWASTLACEVAGASGGGEEGKGKKQVTWPQGSG